MDILDHIVTEIKKTKQQFTDLVEENKFLRKQMEQIFAEEEIKQCPSYELLKATYSMATYEKTKKAKATFVELPSPYQPLKELKASIKSTKKKAAKISVAVKKTNASQQQNNELSSEDCLLPAEEKPEKTTIKKGSSSTETPKAVINVEQVELNGIVFYLHDNKFYDSKTGKLRGKIDSGVILLDNTPLTLVTVKIAYVSDDYYRDNENRAFKLCNKMVARVVGEVQDGDLYMFG